MSELIFEVKIPGRVRIKKNGRRSIGKGKNIPSALFMAWERNSSIDVLRAMPAFRQYLPIKVYCRAEFEFHFKNFQNEADTSNCVEGPQDLLQKLRVLENDRLIVEFNAKKVIGLTECTIIRLFKLDAETQKSFDKKQGKG